MEKLVVYKEPAGQIAEAYRIFCTNLLSGQAENKVIEATGFADNSTASLVVANLAVTMAQAGKKVLLMDCNLHTPQQHELFALNNSGITDCITAGEDYKTFVQATQQTNLFVLTAGSIVVNSPAELLLSAAMQSIITDVKETYDVVLLDVPPVGAASGAITLGVKTDGVLLVIINKQAKVEQAKKAKEMFIKAGISVLGCVLVNVTM